MLKLHVDLMSQPSRAVLSFCNLEKIQCSVVQHFIHKGDLKKTEFLQVNPLGYVPAIEDGSFRLAESHAILIYLHETRRCADHWYPSDPKLRATVNQYLHWHHSNLRALSRVVFHKFEAKSLKRLSNESLLEEANAKTEKSLETMELWLSTSLFLAGQTISLADISAVCELAQGRLINYDLGKYPHVQRWFQDVYQLPEVQRTHEVLEKIVKKKYS